MEKLLKLKQKYQVDLLGIEDRLKPFNLQLKKNEEERILIELQKSELERQEFSIREKLEKVNISLQVFEEMKEELKNEED